MKKSFYYGGGWGVALFAASVLLPMFAFAENATSTPVTNFRHGRVPEKALERMQLRANTATSTPVMREEARKVKEALRAQEQQARLEKLIRKTVDRFNAAVRREEKLADRIASRLDKAAANGKDVAALRLKLTDAREKIVVAKAALAAAVAKLQTVITSPQPKNIMKDVESEFKAVKEKLKVAHAALVDVINSLKGIGNTGTTIPFVPAGGTATSTPPVHQ